MDVAIPYVHQRKQFGRPIGEFQVIPVMIMVIQTVVRTPIG